MRETLIDLTRHCIWADDTLWNACTSLEGAVDDELLIEKMRHVHLVQYAFVSIVRGESLDLSRVDGLTAEGLREWGRSNAVTLLELARLIPDDEFREHIEIPWFKDPPIVISRGEALLQACLHSVHHRGQIASRLRELGGDPPILDYIFWIWKGRPEPA